MKHVLNGGSYGAGYPAKCPENSMETVTLKLEMKKTTHTHTQTVEMNFEDSDKIRYAFAVHSTDIMSTVKHCEYAIAKYIKQLKLHLIFNYIFCQINNRSFEWMIESLMIDWIRIHVDWMIVNMLTKWNFIMKEKRWQIYTLYAYWQRQHALT